MAKKCPNCNSKNTSKSWGFAKTSTDLTGKRGHGKDAYYCFNCGNIFNGSPSGFQYGRHY